MAQYAKSNPISGKWIKGSEVVSGTKCKLVAETKPTSSQFKNKDGSMKMQDVSKVQLEGVSEPLNINLNRATRDAMVDAFGTDSIKWQGNTLTAITEKVVVGGKRVTAIYLLPDGYEMGEDSNGYMVISKIGAQKDASEELPTIELEEGDMNIPF